MKGKVMDEKVDWYIKSLIDAWLKKVDWCMKSLIDAWEVWLCMI